MINFRSLLDTQRSLLDMIEKRSEEKRGYLRIKMKPDLSEEDLDKVVDDFKRQYESRINEEGQSTERFNRMEERD